MFQKSFKTFFMALTLVVISSPLAAQIGPSTETAPAPAENVPALLVKANEAYAAKDYRTFRSALVSLHKLRPNNSDYMYQLVIAHALLDEKGQAYEMMLGMQQQGLAYDFSLTEQTQNLRNTEVFDYVNDMLKLAGSPMGEIEPVFVLPESVTMPETIAWDESRQKFLVGTIAQGQIFAVSKDGELTELLKADNENGLWGIFDILVDSPRNRLWITSASMPGFSGFDPVHKGRSGLFEFDLKTLELIRRYPVPVDGRSHILGSMVLAPNGDIYIADRALPLIYTKPADEQKLKAILLLKELVSQRGIAMQPDGRILYVADREMGIMVVDLVAQQARLLEVPDTYNAGGIDGLYLDNNRLFVIQNGIKPQRVMRLQLDSSGTRVESVGPLAVAQPEFDLPSFGTIQDRDLYFFANSQWLGNSGSQNPVAVVSSDLDATVDLVQPEMELYLKMQAEKTKQQTQEKNN
jgi:sugar lactone lactonase YvrE